MLDKFGFQYVLKLEETNWVRGFRFINGNIWIDYFYHGDLFAAVRQYGVWKRLKIDRENNRSLNSLMSTESKDSFIIYEYPEDDKLNLLLYEYIQQSFISCLLPDS